MNRRCLKACKIAALATGIVSAAAAFAEEPQDIVTISPSGVHEPAGNSYSHAKLIPANAVWLITAGQTGMDPDGNVPKGSEAQADQAMANLKNVLLEADMSANDVIKMTIYYVEPDALDVILAARNRHFGADFRPASTVLVVKALARPKYLVEVEAIAAKVHD